MIRLATFEDIPAIKSIADKNKESIGFVRLPALQEAQARGWLVVAESKRGIIGFANTRHCRDGWITIYEICVLYDMRGGWWGKGMLDFLKQYKKSIRCKVPEGGPIGFYTVNGFEVVRIDPGKKRKLYICEYRPDSM